MAQKVQGSYPGATVTIYISNPVAVAIGSISRASNVVTVTVPTGSGFISGELVTIAGVANASFNGTFSIVSAGASSFTYAQTGGNAASGGGTASSSLRLAQIYSDNQLTSKANPFTAASDGLWFFYAANGRYDVKFSGGDIPAPFTLGDFLVDDPTDENIRIAVNFPGSNAGEKIAAALADLPATGGTVDARGFEGSQSIAQNVFDGIDKPFTLLLGAATFTITASQILASTGVVTIDGMGWSTNVNAVKGDAQWTTLSNHTGTVLYFPASSGSLMDMTTGSATTPVHIRNLMVVGGGGSAVAFAFGSASSGKVQCAWYNVLAANSNLAYQFVNVEDSLFSGVRARGNTNGFYFGDAANENTYTSIEIQAATDKAMQFVGAALNNFFGGLIQSCPSGFGIYSGLLNFSEHNEFIGFWFENAGTFTELEWLNGTSSVFKHWRVASLGVGGLHIGVNAVNCMLDNIRMLNDAPILDEGTGTRLWMVHTGFAGTFTAAGLNTFFYPDPNVSGGFGGMRLPDDLSVIGKIQVTDGLYNITGTTKLIDAVVPASTWTPTFTAIANINSFPAGTRGAYTLNHGMIHANVFLVIEPTADNTATEFDIDLPFAASGVLDDLNAFGTGVCYAAGNPSPQGQPLVLGSGSTSTIRVRFICPTGFAGVSIRQYMSFDYPA